MVKSTQLGVQLSSRRETVDRSIEQHVQLTFAARIRSQKAQGHQRGAQVIQDGILVDIIQTLPERVIGKENQKDPFENTRDVQEIQLRNTENDDGKECRLT